MSGGFSSSSPRRAAIAVLFLSSLLAAGSRFAPSISAEDPKSRPPSKGPTDIFPLSAEGLNPRTGDRSRIPHSDLQAATNYYKSLADDLSFPDKKMPDNLDKLLDYFGYRALRAVDLEEVAPKILMGTGKELEAELRSRWKVRSEAPFPEKNEMTEAGAWPEQKEILAARYFSPKTSDVSGLSSKLSWRKVVRLNARPGWSAAKDGLASMYFLSVLYVNDLNQSPFTRRSLNVQVILARDPTNKASKLKDPVCWLVFDPATNFALGYSTTTSWDAANPELIKEHGVQPYFVPGACVHCHGGDQSSGVVQFFDTDYMLDRMTPGDDFESSVGRSRWGILFDAGRNPYKARFRTNFKAFWELNKEILEQNLAVDPKKELPSTAGVMNWRRLHGEKELTRVLHVPPIKRGVPAGFLGAGGPKVEWSEKDPVDFQLLPLLNRYCYRCHSSLAYNVFNKEDVKERAREMIERLRSPVPKTVPKGPKGWMPQDRRLSYAEKKRLIELLQALQRQK